MQGLVHGRTGGVLVVHRGFGRAQLTQQAAERAAQKGIDGKEPQGSEEKEDGLLSRTPPWVAVDKKIIMLL